ncbi:hypothetical protein [Sphingomonas jeddahensis]|uniref:Uncharacterized protein n=1 Tax=Sphingomonas jeddahensis TaxID=1915074 RepID=A0A1V2EXM4_9SPHN|nr:hypothetical protein [Sphingomonas jeddahensis]ONF97416.1 hypothetical protein SPHI_00450 [Sphingomonas jeddahensis]
MQQMFDAHDEIDFHVLVFAPNSWRASEMAELHRDLGFGFGSTPVSVVPRFMPLAGAASYHLQAALDRNVPGIGHLQLDGSWLILPPGERPPQSTGPTPMQLHNFTDDDGDEYVIFARDWDRAAKIFTAYLDDPNALPGGWIPLTHDHWRTLGLVRHGHQAESRGVEGVGRYTAAGWVILAVDYHRLGLSAP